MLLTDNLNKSKMNNITLYGRECLIFECGEQPQVLLIQPLGEHERSTIDNEIALIRETVQVPFVMAALAISMPTIWKH